MDLVPVEFEVHRRPVWDPAPGTACLWQCLKDKTLSMHRLSDRVLGSLYIAISSGLIKPVDCDASESDLAQRFKIRSPRTRLNLGQGLLTPDGKAVVSIPTRSLKGLLVLRGSGNATAKLPVVRYDPKVFQENYPNWEQWRDELLYLQRPDGTLDVTAFASYPQVKNESTPPDWHRCLPPDRTFASEVPHRQNKANPKKSFQRDTVDSKSELVPALWLRSKRGPSTLSDLGTFRSAENSSSTSRRVLSIAEIIDERYGFEDRNGKRVIVLTDSENETDTLEIPRKRTKNTAEELVLSESPIRQKPPSPDIAPIEIHKAAFQAAFRDKSVQRTELFHALLPYITVADAEEILIRCQRVAAVISESKFE